MQHESKITVLFLCTGNSCRSQMAEGWIRHLKHDTIECFSAGTESHRLNPYAVLVMKEAGVDISAQKSKTIGRLEKKEFDYVITLCDNAARQCPYFPAKKALLHHPFEDPAAFEKTARSEEEVLACYRRVRDEIKAFVETLPQAL
jgi:arsenate reductase